MGNEEFEGGTDCVLLVHGTTSSGRYTSSIVHWVMTYRCGRLKFLIVRDGLKGKRKVPIRIHDG
jgi:hypothetical protein